MGQNAALRGADALGRFLRKEISWMELGQSRTISTVSIVLTYRCPAACAHCVFGCDMNRRERVDPAQAKVFLEAAARQDPPPGVGFSGGEPFLELPMLQELIAFAHHRRMASEVISSSAWCRSRRHAKEVLSSLQQRGLVTYCTSVDRYHVRYVAPKRMREAILAARELGLRVAINTLADPKRMGAEKEYLARTLELPIETVEDCRVNVLKVVPAGRARTEVSDFLRRDKDLAEGCPYCTEIVSLTPDGLVYPCCGMIVGEDPRKAHLFVVGSLAGKTVEEVAAMLEDVKRDLFLRLLQVIGPYRILMILKDRTPDLVIPRSFVGTCDMCMELARNPAVAERLRELLLRWQAALAGQARGG